MRAAVGQPGAGDDLALHQVGQLLADRRPGARTGRCPKKKVATPLACGWSVESQCSESTMSAPASLARSARSRSSGLGRARAGETHRHPDRGQPALDPAGEVEHEVGLGQQPALRRRVARRRGRGRARRCGRPGCAPSGGPARARAGRGREPPVTRAAQVGEGAQRLGPDRRRPAPGRRRAGSRARRCSVSGPNRPSTRPGLNPRASSRSCRVGDVVALHQVARGCATAAGRRGAQRAPSSATVGLRPTMPSTMQAPSLLERRAPPRRSASSKTGSPVAPVGRVAGAASRRGGRGRPERRSPRRPRAVHGGTRPPSRRVLAASERCGADWLRVPDRLGPGELRVGRADGRSGGASDRARSAAVRRDAARRVVRRPSTDARRQAM